MKSRHAVKEGVQPTSDQGSPRRRGRSHVETSLCLLKKKYRENRSVVDRPRARVPKKLTSQHYVFIDQCLENDDELTSRKFYHLLVEKYPYIGVLLSTVKRTRRELGWVLTRPKI